MTDNSSTDTLHVSVECLHNRPSTREVDLVDAEFLLPIAISNTGVDVVVVQDRSKRRVVVHTLPSRTVDPAVRFQDRGSTAVGTAHARLVDEAASRAGRSAYLNLVLLACSGLVLVESAALADRKEQIVVLSVLCDKGGLLSMRAGRLVRNPGAGSAGCDGKRRVVHFDAVKITPEGAE